MLESAKRSVVKSVSYRTFTSIVNLLVLLLLTGSFATAWKLGLTIELFKILTYYIHERAWSSIRYGMIHPKGRTFWFTGLSGSGKTTIANALAEKLKDKGYAVQILDGDSVRNTINKGLGFSEADRERNIFNIAHIAKLFNEAGVIVLVPVISPYDKLRKMARSIIEDFTGIYIKCPLSVCEERDPKGLYKKVRAGEIKNFTGISDPFEEPTEFEISIDTSEISLQTALEIIIAKSTI